jgi:hypothetical protein
MALKWREKRGLNNAGNIMESGEYYGIKMLGDLHNFIVLILVCCASAEGIPMPAA